MITCQHARQLFDRHLDDELVTVAAGRTARHVIQCNSCQNQLALYEACGDVIRLDVREPRPSSSFADRVMAGRAAGQGWGERRPAKRPWLPAAVGLAIGGPMAAAAAIVLMLMGMFAIHHGSTRPTVIAGDTAAVPKAVQENLLNHQSQTRPRRLRQNWPGRRR